MDLLNTAQHVNNFNLITINFLLWSINISRELLEQSIFATFKQSDLVYLNLKDQMQVHITGPSKSHYGYNFKAISTGNY
ncbi:hypothetical protein [Maridesulfovibrio bastinii]|uniref:hypothetical protein n=1 Tax=Maridesulfovibrio bastinii TaxID=47157 RepID=UPI000405C79B|nr:hypothetical protein [Maridesulfovibrio bastinii]